MKFSKGDSYGHPVSHSGGGINGGGFVLGRYILLNDVKVPFLLVKPFRFTLNCKKKKHE
jgi:hypothetical protein